MNRTRRNLLQTVLVGLVLAWLLTLLGCATLPDWAEQQAAESGRVVGMQFPAEREAIAEALEASPAGARERAMRWGVVPGVVDYESATREHLKHLENYEAIRWRLSRTVFSYSIRLDNLARGKVFLKYMNRAAQAVRETGDE